MGTPECRMLNPVPLPLAIGYVSPPNPEPQVPSPEPQFPIWRCCRGPAPECRMLNPESCSSSLKVYTCSEAHKFHRRPQPQAPSPQPQAPPSCFLPDNWLGRFSAGFFACLRAGRQPLTRLDKILRCFERKIAPFRTRRRRRRGGHLADSARKSAGQFLDAHCARPVPVSQPRVPSPFSVPRYLFLRG